VAFPDEGDILDDTDAETRTVRVGLFGDVYAYMRKDGKVYEFRDDEEGYRDFEFAVGDYLVISLRRIPDRFLTDRVRELKKHSRDFFLLARER